MDIEILSLNLTVKVHFKNARGLTRSAGLEFEIERDKLDTELANKGKFNKFVGDMVMDAYNACLEVAQEEYRGKGRPDSPSTDEEADRLAKDLWKEQNARASAAQEQPTPDAENMDAHPGKETKHGTTTTTW